MEAWCFPWLLQLPKNNLCQKKKSFLDTESFTYKIVALLEFKQHDPFKIAPVEEGRD